jgi:hypothetical protein
VGQSVWVWVCGCVMRLPRRFTPRIDGVIFGMKRVKAHSSPVTGDCMLRGVVYCEGI